MATNHGISKKTVSKYRKNQYRSFIKKLGMGHTLPKLEKQKLFWYYMEQRHSTIDYLQDDFDMPPHTLRNIRDAFEFYYTTVEVGEKYPYPSLTIYEAFFLTRSLLFAIFRLYTKDSKMLKEFRTVLNTIQEPVLQKVVNMQMTNMLYLATSIHSSLDSYVYGYDLVYKAGDSRTGIPAHYRFIILRKKVPSHEFTIEKKKRLAHKLIINRGYNTFIKEKVVWCGNQYKVYMQSHALRRLEERLNLKSHHLQFKISNDIQFDLPRKFQGNVLIPVISNRTTPHRVGYFLCAFTNKVCVLKTFLFISQNGTPEGEKLNEQLAINKIDKKYLELDKLQHFTQSDLKDDIDLRPIFEASRLDHLFEIEDTTMLPDFSKNATFIKEMLQLN